MFLPSRFLVSATAHPQLQHGPTPQELRASVLDFVTNLVVANTAFVHTCLQVLVYSFLPPPAPPPPVDPADAGKLWQPSAREAEVQAAVIAALDRVLQLVPTASGSLVPLVVQHMPHRMRDTATQCLYLRCALAIAEAPTGVAIRDGLLGAIVEHLLSIDVEIKWEDIADPHVDEGAKAEEGGSEALEEENDEDDEDIFALEGVQDLDLSTVHRDHHGARDGWEGAASTSSGHHGAAAAAAAPATQQAAADAAAAGTSDAAAAGAAAAAKPPVDETAHKLDCMLHLVFEHLGARCSDAEGTKQLWSALLAIFERSILQTHRSKFTQFLLFYVCVREPEHCSRSLVRLLLSRVQDSGQPPTLRAACAAYLSSFLARAAFLPQATVTSTLKRLARFCLNYASALFPSREVQLSSGGPGSVRDLTTLMVNVHATSSSGTPETPRSALSSKQQVLYSCCQGLLYVLCYHLTPVLGAFGADRAAPAAKALADLVTTDVGQLVRHACAPLAVCLPSVAAEFSHQAAALELLQCGPLLPDADADAPSARANRPLEMFFPFDPFLLQHSASHLRLAETYVRWRRGHPTTVARAAAWAKANGGGGGGDLSGSSEDREMLEGDHEGEESGRDGASGSSDDDDEGMTSTSDSEDGDGAMDSDSEDGDIRFGVAPRPFLVGSLRRNPSVKRPMLGTSYTSYTSNNTTDDGGSAYGGSPILVNYISPVDPHAAGASGLSPPPPGGFAFRSSPGLGGAAVVTPGLGGAVGAAAGSGDHGRAAGTIGSTSSGAKAIAKPPAKKIAKV